MPLARYFLFVGVALLAALIFADAFLPRTPLAESAEPHQYSIRLYSDERWPERIELDTSIRAISSAPGAIAEAKISSAPRIAAEQAVKPPQAQADADRPANTREAFAELRQNASAGPPSTDPKKPRAEKPRNAARRHAPPRMHFAWRQPSYGWYGSPHWW